MKPRTPRLSADVGLRATWATGAPEGDGLARPAGLLLVLSLATVLSASQRAPAPSGGVRGVKAGNQRALVGPEGDPLDMPTDVAVGLKGDVYVLDGVHHRVVVYDAEGTFRFQFGARGNGLGELLYPLGLGVGPDGKVYIADSGNHRLQAFTPDGKPLEVIPLATTGGGSAPDPTDVVVDSARQRLYVADNDNHHILRYSLANHRFEGTWGTPGQGERQFRFPFLLDLASDGYLLVVEPINTRVQVLNPDGKFVRFIGGWGVMPGQLFRPKGVTVRDGRVFVTDSYLGTVQVFHLNGDFLGALTDAAGGVMKFTTPTGIAVDADRRRLYVVELKANQVCSVDLE